MVGGLVGGQEGGLVEGQGADLVEVQEAEDEALDPSCLQGYQEASRMEEHLKNRRYHLSDVEYMSTASTSLKQQQVLEFILVSSSAGV